MVRLLVCVEHHSTKIEQDFSNYSAWHYRTVLIPVMHKSHDAAYWKRIDNGQLTQLAHRYTQCSADDSCCLQRSKLPFALIKRTVCCCAAACWCDGVTEFSLVRQAFYTEPADQSGWLYHRWLLSRVVQTLPTLPQLLIALGHNDMDSSSNSSSGSHTGDAGEEATHDGASGVDALAVFSRELAMCRELDAIEPNCKWILLTTALLIAGTDAINTIQQQQRDAGAQSAEAQSGESEESVTAELGSLFARLTVLDPMRTNYYRDVHDSFTNRKGSSPPSAPT